MPREDPDVFGFEAKRQGFALMLRGSARQACTESCRRKPKEEQRVIPRTALWKILGRQSAVRAGGSSGVAIVECVRGGLTSLVFLYFAGGSGGLRVMSGRLVVNFVFLTAPPPKGEKTHIFTPF